LIKKSTLLPKTFNTIRKVVCATPRYSMETVPSSPRQRKGNTPPNKEWGHTSFDGMSPILSLRCGDAQAVPMASLTCIFRCSIKKIGDYSQYNQMPALVNNNFKSGYVTSPVYVFCPEVNEFSVVKKHMDQKDNYDGP